MGAGPRYCPSFEDKIVKFADKPRHQIFLEPESKHMDTIYVQGFSTSMPIDVQEKMLKSLPGMENVKVLKWAYAIEYDAIVPTQLKHTLELKTIKNLYTAGQINGTSGYEEAACQGYMAGINAALANNNKPEFILRRDEAYIGVLIDDLVTKGTVEPYRLLTSRAEFRLHLRNDNAEVRLKHYSKKYGLISEQEWNEFDADYKQALKVGEDLKKTFFTMDAEIITLLQKQGFTFSHNRISAYDLFKRPDIDVEFLYKHFSDYESMKMFWKQFLLINIRFEGYINQEIKK